MVIRSLGTDAYALYVLTSQSIHRRISFGTNIYERDWDLAIVLDACRVDALEAVASEYEFIDKVSSIWSVGSTSKEWLDNTFVTDWEDEVAGTAMISSNPFTNQIRERPIDYLEYPPIRDSSIRRLGDLLLPDTTLLRNNFKHFDAVWEYEESENRKHTTPQPDEVTDRAIWAGRNVDADRYIVHYMQPHAPYFANVNSGDELTNLQANPFEALRSGASLDTVWNEYLDNLRYVLDSVEILLKNFDAESVVITADHGELFDDYRLSGHSVGLPFPEVRKVPWTLTTASDTRNTRGEPPSEGIDTTVQAHLEELGYL
jgi:hypothetical protein